MAAAAAEAPLGGSPSHVQVRKEAWRSAAASHRRCSAAASSSAMRPQGGGVGARLQRERHGREPQKE
eukprot:4913453-Alexandrium_andersonii.AAC.1